MAVGVPAAHRLESGGSVGRIQLGDLECGGLHLIAAVHADPDVVHAAGWVLEHHQRIQADEIVVAVPAPIGGVDHQGGIGTGFDGDIERHAASRIVQVEIGGIGHDVTGAVRSQFAIHFCGAACL